MTKKMSLAWAVVERATGRLVILDAQPPIFWNRRVARDVACERGLGDSYGRNAQYEIRRVSISALKGPQV